MQTWFSKKAPGTPGDQAGLGVPVRTEQRVSTAVMTPPPASGEVRKPAQDFDTLEGLNKRLGACCFDFRVNQEEFQKCLGFYRGQSGGLSLMKISVQREARKRAKQKLGPTAASEALRQETDQIAKAMKGEANWQMLLEQAEKLVRHRDSIPPNSPVNRLSVEAQAKTLLEQQKQREKSPKTPTPFQSPQPPQPPKI